MRRLTPFCLVLFLLLSLIPAHAQENTVRVDVFLELDPTTGGARIYFVDALTGLSTLASVDQGRNFTLVGDYVLYEKPENGVIMRATLNGLLEPHPFIHRSVGVQALSWTVSPDHQSIAWTVTAADGSSTAYAAWADGHDLRQLPIESPQPPLQLYPLALADGMQRFFYDSAHPATSAAPYAIFEHIRAYSLVDEAFVDIPQEPICPCSAALAPGGRILGRLEAAQGQGPFILHVWDLPTGADITIPPPNFSFQTGGDLILNNNATLAAYSLSEGVGSDTAPEQYALVLADVVAGQQVVALPPGDLRYRPVSFIDNDEALLLTASTGTYKLALSTGELKKVSNYIYLGAITQSPAAAAP